MRTYSLEQFRDDIRPLEVRFQRRAPNGPTLRHVLKACEFMQQIDGLVSCLSPDERANPALISQERVADLLDDVPISADDVRSFRLVYRLFQRMSVGG